MTDNPDLRQPWLTEEAVVHRSTAPVTRPSIVTDLQRLGLTPGMTVLVHSSLSSLGWVNGGAEAVVPALMDVVTDQGTIVMPSFSTGNTEPEGWQEPAVPEEWWETVRTTMPPYNPYTTPTRSMGVISELFRTWPGVVRSRHPSTSFSAWGIHADLIVGDHSYHYGLGEHSPLARVYDLDGWVLLLGVGFGNNTSFHLAEYRAPGTGPSQQGASVLQDGKATWIILDDIKTDDEEFPRIGAEYEETGNVAIGQVGFGTARLFRQRPAVDFAVGRIAELRNQLA